MSSNDNKVKRDTIMNSKAKLVHTAFYVNISLNLNPIDYGRARAFGFIASLIQISMLFENIGPDYLLC